MSDPATRTRGKKKEKAHNVTLNTRYMKQLGLDYQRNKTFKKYQLFDSVACGVRRRRSDLRNALVIYSLTVLEIRSKIIDFS